VMLNKRPYLAEGVAARLARVDRHFAKKFVRFGFAESVGVRRAPISEVGAKHSLRTHAARDRIAHSRSDVQPESTSPNISQLSPLNEASAS
jgi:hypothetical protein